MIESTTVRMLKDHESGAKKGNEVVVRDWQAEEWKKLGIAEIADRSQPSSSPAPVNTGEDIKTSEADVQNAAPRAQAQTTDADASGAAPAASKRGAAKTARAAKRAR